MACFELVAERQLLKYRREYFQAILRQDIGWFDINGGLELPSSIAGDTTLMREGIGMKFGQGVRCRNTPNLSHARTRFCPSVPIVGRIWCR